MANHTTEEQIRRIAREVMQEEFGAKFEQISKDIGDLRLVLLGNDELRSEGLLPALQARLFRVEKIIVSLMVLGVLITLGGQAKNIADIIKLLASWSPHF